MSDQAFDVYQAYKYEPDPVAHAVLRVANELAALRDSLDVRNNLLRESNEFLKAAREIDKALIDELRK